MQSSISSMTLDEQIGQALAIGFHGTTPSQAVIELIQKQHVGTIILFSRNIQTIQQVRRLTQHLQMLAKEAGHRYPLLIAIDQENGMVRRLGQDTTILPGNMAVGAINSEQIAYDVALATGRELLALGINMNLAPVVDVNNNPTNPVIGVRSFGEDPHKVARFAAAMVRGYQAAGVISCLKHFPGHGDTTVDSHLALPHVPHAMQRLEEVELVPFKSGIAAGADSVMIAHIHLPSLMPQEMAPSTVSPIVVRELLREKLGFAGMIVSDCMEMRALAKTIGTEHGVVMALQAGIDLVMVSHTPARQRGSIAVIQAAVQAGMLSPEVVRQAATRVIELKQRMLSWDMLPDEAASEVISSAAHQQLRDRAYECSTTLVRDTDHLLPLHLEPNQRITVLFLRPVSFTLAIDKQVPEDVLIKSLRQHHPHIDTLSIVPKLTPAAHERIQQAISKADIVIVVTVNAYLDAAQGKVVRQLLQSGHQVIGIAVYNPYDLLAFPQLGTYLVTYECTPPALIAAVRALFGEFQPQGRLPVSLPGLYRLE